MSQNDEGNFRGSANIEFFSRDSLLRALQMHGDVRIVAVVNFISWNPFNLNPKLVG